MPEIPVVPLARRPRGARARGRARLVLRAAQDAARARGRHAPRPSAWARPSRSSGHNFKKDAAANTVFFGPLKAQVTEATATQLKATVPAGPTGPVAVVVQTKEGRSSTVNVTVRIEATATAVSPDVAMAGQVVLVRGEGLVGQTLSAQVAGIDAPSVEATAEGARVTIPSVPLPEGSATQLVLSAGSAPPKTFDIYIGRLPLVIDVEPKFGAIGDPVVLTGRGFMPDPHQNAVTFAGQPALVLKASTTSLTVIAPPPPPDEVQPDLPVVVAAGGRASTGSAAFKLTRTSSSGFLPRFFAAPVVEFPGSGYAFVSSELGPVLLLGGPAESASTADRAVALAAALNALVTNAQAKPPAFELRERPQPGVGVVGDVRTFLVPTPEDAEAYSKNWETGRGAGRRVAPAAVARHWAALLQDYFGLFLYRQRPLRLAAISPRGKVFTEIYGEANRRAPGGNNVPTSVVLPPSESLETGLRLAALVVSGDAGRAAVAVEGHWDGTMDDPDFGKRAFQVQVRHEGGRLAGTLTTWRGSIELTSPLREIGFEQRPGPLHGRPAGGRVPLQGHAREHHRDRHDRARRQGRRPLHAAVRGVAAWAGVVSGLERLLERPEPVRGLRVGLVVNPSSITSELVHASLALGGRRGVTLTALFGPEHGIAADAQDLVEVGHSRDRETGLPVYSLYGETRVPTASMLAGVDAMVYDVQDVGSRYYTFVYTMLHVIAGLRPREQAGRGARPAEPARGRGRRRQPARPRLPLLRRDAPARGAPRHDERASSRSCSARSWRSTSTSRSCR